MPSLLYSLRLSSSGLGTSGQNEGIRKQRSCSVTGFVLVTLEGAFAVTVVYLGSG